VLGGGGKEQLQVQRATLEGGKRQLPPKKSKDWERWGGRYGVIYRKFGARHKGKAASWGSDSGVVGGRVKLKRTSGSVKN